MKTMKTHPRARQTGQGMSEYIIITALIAVAAIGTFGFFGSAIESQVSALANSIAGTGNAGGATTNAQTAANAIDEDGNAEDLATFGADADGAVP